MASTFKIRLLSLELQATREPKPYHDRIVTSLVVSVGGKAVTSPDVPPDQVGKHAYCAFVGAGTVLDFTAFQPGWGHPLEFEFVIEDSAKATGVRIFVHVANWRGLPDKIIEKALLAMGVATATASAGLAAEGLTTAVKWGVTLAAAMGGEGLKELIEGFALEVPKCRGTVYVKEITLTSDDLFIKPFETTVLPDGTINGVFVDSESSDPIQDIPAEGCGQPKAVLTYAIERMTPGSFAGGKPIAFGRVPEMVAPLRVWFGQWSDSPWSLSRVFIVIEHGTAVGADVLKVTIREAIGSWGGQVVVNLTADNLPVTLGTHTKYWGDVFAQKSPFAPILAPDPKKNPFVVAVSGSPSSAAVMNQSGALSDDAGPAVALPMSGSTAAMTVPAQSMHTLHKGNPTGIAGLADTFDPSMPVIGASVQSSIAVFDPVPVQLEKTLTVSLPNHGITLALYAVVVADSHGNPVKVGDAVRYSRVANMWATRTDAMLTRFAPEKLA
jgi:hypothetical protein